MTIGMFDGVHVAHQHLIRSTVRWARRLRGTSVAITFDPDPQAVLGDAPQPCHCAPQLSCESKNGGRHGRATADGRAGCRPHRSGFAGTTDSTCGAPPLALMPLAERVRLLRAYGIQQVWVIPFTKRFARVSAQQFVERILIKRFHAVALVVGEGFAFGNRRRGTLSTLRTLGPRYGLRIIAVGRVMRGNEPVSSSRIRRLIASGALRKARVLLGRPPALYGEVMPGAGRGRRLGIPTANLRLLPQVLPPPGVYAVTVQTSTRKRTWGGMTPPPIRVRDPRTGAKRTLAYGELIGGGVMNLGVRPTFGAGPFICEVHLLGFHGTLRGQSVSVSLLARLRHERCFESPHALVQQIHRDIRRARHLLARHSS